MAKKKRKQKQNQFLLFSSFLLLLSAGIFLGVQRQETIPVSLKEPAAPSCTPTPSPQPVSPTPEPESEEEKKWKEISRQTELYPEDLLADLERNPEMLDFVYDYPNMEPKTYGGLSEKEKKEKTPLFLQWDKRWGYVPYGSLNIGVAGCGPTCLSMVLFSLTGEERFTPDLLADYSMERGYYVKGTGTSWLFMTEAASHFGVHAEHLHSWTESSIRTALEDGTLFICSMRPGDFTDTGHFIMIRGCTENGFLVNDPFSQANSRKEWDYETLNSQCKQMWSYSLFPPGK